MDSEWIRWALGIVGVLATTVGGLVWWDIRRIAKNLHALRTETSSLVLRVEQEMRANHRSAQEQIQALQTQIAEVRGGQVEAKNWRDLVLELVRLALPTR